MSFLFDLVFLNNVSPENPKLQHPSQRGPHVAPHVMPFSAPFASPQRFSFFAFFCRRP
jgi:hypothetical protein